MGWTDLPEKGLSEDAVRPVRKGDSELENDGDINVNVDVSNTLKTDPMAKTQDQDLAAEQLGQTFAHKLLHAYQVAEGHHPKADVDRAQRLEALWARAQVHARAKPVPVDQKQKVSQRTSICSVRLNALRMP